MAAGKKVNVAVAAYVTTQAQLKLYGYLNELGASVLYCDTGSVIFVQNVDEPPNVRIDDYLGRRTEELEKFGSGSFIQEHVSGCPKNYPFSVLCPPTGKHKPNAR